MDEVIFLTEKEIDDYAYSYDFSDKSKALSTIKDLILYVPSMININKKFIAKAIEHDSSYKLDILQILRQTYNEDYINISLMIHHKFLKDILSDTTDLLIPVEGPLKSINNVQIACIIKSIDQHKYEPKDNELDIFMCLSILKYFGFSKKECFLRLKDYKFITIIRTFNVLDDCYHICIILELCRIEGFFEVLAQSISSGTLKVKYTKELVSYLFVGAYSERDNCLSDYVFLQNERDKKLLSSLFTDEIIEYTKKVSNWRILSNFLNSYKENDQKYDFKETRQPFIKASEIINCQFKDKVDFFNKFILVTSPSISHFLSYLEHFKEQFRLSQEEQAIFMDLFKKFHAENPAYLEIALSKLYKFKIIKE
jgi:hypothetical protein